jgi:arsenate reductase (thioredoxin)
VLRPEERLPTRVLRRALLLRPERTALFVCVENACRSLMAEAMFNAIAPDGWHAISAGTAPAGAPNPRTEGMLREIGLSMPEHPPRPLSNEMMDEASARVTMGCLDSASCPARLKSLAVVDWGLPDPSTLDDPAFRAVRDEIRARVEALCRAIRSDDVPPA